MTRPFQFSLRALLVATTAAGPVIAAVQWLFNLSWLSVLFMSIVCALLAVVLGSQAILLKVVTRNWND